MDKELVITRPTKVRSILDTILSEGLTDLQGILSIQKIRLEFLSDLLDIHLDFFKKYQDPLNQFASVYYLDNFKKI